MRSYPSTPDVDDAPEALDGGHLWIREWIDGAPLRFQLRDSGILRFGGAHGIFDPDDVPGAYRHATTHVRERLDRGVLREAVDDVESVVLFAVATQRQTIDYDWDRLPSVLGTEVWSGDAGFLSPDAAMRVFDRLGLEPVNAHRKEIPPRDFSPSTDSIPDSAWYDGPSAGIEIRNTKGPRGKLLHPDVPTETPPPEEPFSASAAELAVSHATADRVARIADRLGERGVRPTTEAVYERLYEETLRRQHRRFNHPESSIDLGEFRSELVAVVAEHLE